MLEIAGLIVSGIGLIKDLYALNSDLGTWANEELEVDRDWLPLALENGLLPGAETDYRFVRCPRVETLKLKGTYEVVAAHNDERKIIYRIVQGPLNDRIVLMKRLSPDP